MLTARNRFFNSSSVASGSIWRTLKIITGLLRFFNNIHDTHKHTWKKTLTGFQISISNFGNICNIDLSDCKMNTCSSNIWKHWKGHLLQMDWDWSRSSRVWGACQSAAWTSEPNLSSRSASPEHTNQNTPSNLSPFNAAALVLCWIRKRDLGRNQDLQTNLYRNSIKKVDSSG